MSSVLRRRGAATGLIAALVLVGGPGVAIGAPPEYVALGDSYASGLGTREYYINSGTCQRSPHAYPVSSAARLGAQLTFKACSKATIDEVTEQLRALDAATRYVSMQVGGNDAGFTRVITECAKPVWMQDCVGAVRTARRFINRRLPQRLADLYSRIERRSPSASVVVVGYPRLFHDEDCNAATWFGPADRTLLNDTADLLNRRISAQARASGFRFANPTRAFLGHAICDSPEWVNGLSSPITESYHPNRAGHVGFARLVTRRLR
jgi:lysophospholipase L1-like esterase